MAIRLSRHVADKLAKELLKMGITREVHRCATHEVLLQMGNTLRMGVEEEFDKWNDRGIHQGFGA